MSAREKLDAQRNNIFRSSKLIDEHFFFKHEKDAKNKSLMRGSVFQSRFQFTV